MAFGKQITWHWDACGGNEPSLYTHPFEVLAGRTSSLVCEELVILGLLLLNYRMTSRLKNSEHWGNLNTYIDLFQLLVGRSEISKAPDIVC